MGDNCQTDEWGLKLVEDLVVIIKFTAWQLGQIAFR